MCQYSSLLYRFLSKSASILYVKRARADHNERQQMDVGLRLNELVPAPSDSVCGDWEVGSTVEGPLP